MDIFFEDRKEFYEKERRNKENSIVIYALLRQINRFLMHFRTFLFAWTRNYMQEVNCRRNPEEDEMTMENAISTILDKFELSNAGRKLILGGLRSSSFKREKKELLPDNSFYQQGIEIFELEDQDAHHDTTSLRLVAIYDTPEKILIYLAEKATVVGVSATAEVPSVVGNYDLIYLHDKLEDNFHPTSERKKEQIRSEMQEAREAYEDGRVNIHAEVIEKHDGDFDVYGQSKKIFDNPNYALICGNKIRNAIEDTYYQMRYCNIAGGIRICCKEDLYVGTFYK